MQLFCLTFCYNCIELEIFYQVPTKLEHAFL